MINRVSERERRRDRGGKIPWGRQAKFKCLGARKKEGGKSV